MSGLRFASRAVDLSLTIDRAVRYLTLNIAWALVSLTIVGAPAATAALHAVVKEWGEGDEHPVLPRFISALRRDGLQATGLGIVAAAVLAVIAVNLSIVPAMGVQGRFVTAALLAVATPVSLLLATLPSALADSTDGVRNTLTLAGRRMVSRPATSVAAAILAGLVVLTAMALPPLLLVTPSLAVRLHRGLMNRPRRNPSSTQLTRRLA